MRFPVSVFSVVLVLAAAHGPAQAAPPAAVPDEAVETIRLHEGELPAVELTSRLLYRILVAELAAQAGQYEDAAQGLMSLARDSSDPRLAQRAFQMAMTGRNLGLALLAARQWADLAPDDPEAVATSLALSASSGQTDGLARTLRRRIDAAGDRDEAIAQAASIVSRMADKRLALEVLDRAFANVIDRSALARLALADASWAAGERRRAVDEAHRAQLLEPDSTEAARRILEYGLREDPTRALRETQDFLDRHPDERTLRLLLISRLAERGVYDEALTLLGRMRQRNPEDFDLLYTEAEVNVRAQRYDAAKTLLSDYILVQQSRRRALADGATSAQADTSDARLLLVRIAERQDDLKEAVRQLYLIDEPSLIFQARTHAAVLYGRMGDLARARETLNGIKPADRRERIVLRLTLASIYRDAGRTDEAVDLLKATDLEMPDTPEVKYDLGMLVLQQGRHDEFEALMRRVIELDPDNANAYNSLGYTWVEQGQNLDEARDLLERALDLEPENPYILDSVGWYLFQVGDYQGALEYLRRSWERLAAGDVAAHLGEALWMLDRRGEAREIWSQGQQKDPDSETLRTTLERLGVTLP